MKKARRKQRTKKKPTHQFGVMKVPKGVVVVDSGVVITDEYEQEWDTDYKEMEPKDGEQSKSIHR